MYININKNKLMNSPQIKYKLIIFDFDNTLCNINTFVLKIKLEDINKNNKTIIVHGIIKHISSLFNDYNDLTRIFANLKNIGVKLSIASFGNLDVISKILEIAFPNLFDYILTPDNIDKETNMHIIKNSRYIVDLNCSKMYGKNIMIQTIMKKCNITNPTNVLFLDDDYNNVNCSLSMEIDSYNNTIFGITAQLLIDLIYRKRSDIKCYKLYK